MFLLNRILHPVIVRNTAALHPIMFLLNHSPTTPPVEKPRCFTSHYVPIKSTHGGGASGSLVNFTSHYVPIKSNTSCKLSTTFVIFTSHYVPIKSATAYVKTINAAIFTSHYVPIKSYSIPYLQQCNDDTLHPIMFLLNLYLLI